MSVIDEIAAERQRQIDVEGWTLGHDDEHRVGELARAAACYAHNAGCYDGHSQTGRLWPWSMRWWKPRDRRRDLIRAGALIVAEIERLDRAASASPPDHGDECDIAASMQANRLSR